MKHTNIAGLRFTFLLLEYTFVSRTLARCWRAAGTERSS